MSGFYGGFVGGAPGHSDVEQSLQDELDNVTNVLQLHVDKTKKLLDMGLLDDAHPAQIYLEEYEVMTKVATTTTTITTTLEICRNISGGEAHHSLSFND